MVDQSTSPTNTDLSSKLFGAFEKYVSNLYRYNEETSQELEQLCSNGVVKKLFTIKENAPFYATGRDKSIKPITQDAGTGISPFTDTILNRIINGEQYEHGNYHDAIFNDILKEEKLNFSYWLVTTNKNSDYAFDALDRFPKEKVIQFSKPNLKMQEGEIAFIYVSHTHSIPMKTRIKEIYRDDKNPEENYYVLEFIDFIEEITLKELQRVGFSEKSLVKTQEFKRVYLSDIYAKRKRDNRNNKEINMIVNNPNFTNKMQNIKQPPLNQILYGSPGTGKTYSTIEKALEICISKQNFKSFLNQIEPNLSSNITTCLHALKNKETSKEILQYSRTFLREKFNKLKKYGIIEFVTFHQNYGYEEFVEGIKPKLDDNEKNSKIEYEIKNGIFKQLCTTNQKAIEVLGEHKENRIWKVSLGEKKYHDNLRANESDYLWNYCRTHNEIRIGWTKEEKNSSIANFENEIKVGDIVCIFDSTKTIKAIGIVTSEASYNEKEPNGYENTHLQYFKRVRKVKWIYEGILEIQNGNRQLDQNTVYQLDEVSIPYLIEQISKTESKPRILVIDEINRGNISKIFGELITLIEPSKRIGADEELRVTLPYSQTSFGVPSNLYIIGTMNTADRSITSLDTALRRRFEFVEMMPNPEALTNLKVYRENKDTKINLVELLQAINDRIEFLYDREKTIGHAFFLSEMQYDEDMDCYFIEFSRLKNIFQNKIIPLLQEYFYNDYEAINAVLNNNGMIEVKVDNNKQEKSKYIFKGAFKELVNNRGLDEKKIFQVAPKDPLNENDKNLWNDPQTYINIYEG